MVHARPRVNIVGAGIAGLALGRCLLKNGVPFNIFEKKPSIPSHRYGIVLHEDAYQPLFDYLGQANIKRAIAVDRRFGGKGLLINDTGSHPSDKFCAEHGALLETLRQGLTIDFGHDLVDCSPTKEGMTLFFRNGRSSTAPITVDAGGESSGLRARLCPNVRPAVLPWVALHGVRIVSQATFEAEYADIYGDSNHISLGRTELGDWELTLTKTHLGEDKVEMRYTLLRPASLTGDPLFRPDRTPQEAAVIPEEFWLEMDRLVAGCRDEAIKLVLDTGKMKSDRLLSWLMRTSLVPPSTTQELAQLGVYSLGDAYYSTPITVSGGANRALRAAFELARQIEEGSTSMATTPSQCPLDSAAEVDPSRLDVTYRLNDYIKAMTSLLLHH